MDNQQPILHIGYPKTASTWFQRVFYPSLSNVRYIRRKPVQDLILRPGPFDWDLKTCKEAITAEGKGKLAICEELLLGRLKPGGLNHFLTVEIAYRLKQIFPQASIIIFIRNQFDALSSAYLQYLRAGGNYGINKFLFPTKIVDGDLTPLVLLGLQYFRYDQVIQLYCDLYGKENVYIYLYEQFEEDPKGFILDYMKRFNLKGDVGSMDFSRVNEGFRRGLIPFLRFANSFTRKKTLNKYYILHLPRVFEYNKWAFSKANKFRIFGSKPTSAQLLGSKNIKHLHQFYAESNNSLLRTYNLQQMKKYGYPI